MGWEAGEGGDEGGIAPAPVYPSHRAVSGAGRAAATAALVSVLV